MTEPKMTEKETSPNLSTQKVLLPGHDPGWNDPPNWVYSGAQSSTITPTKRVLNKRVAFPLASAQVADKDSSTRVASKPMNMTPPLQSSNNLLTMSHPPSTSLSNKATDVTESQTELDKNQVLNDALANLQTVIDEHVDKSKAEEVQRRLDLMKTLWAEDKLNTTIHQKILEISKALLEKNIELADQIHVTLMMQHASLCSSWIPGIRHIILELKTKSQNQNAT